MSIGNLASDFRGHYNYYRSDTLKILITPRGFANNGLKEIKRMEDLGLSVDYNDTGLPYSAETFLMKGKEADAIIVGVDIIDKAFIDECPKLKVICKFGVGTDNIDVNYAQSKGVFVGRTVGSNSLAVAEHVMSFMYATSKNLYFTIKEVKEHNWKKPTGTELAGKKLSIIGFGEIGKQLSLQAVGIGMDVMVNDVFEISQKTLDEYHVIKATHDDIFKKADYISLHLPLLDSTRNLVSKTELNQMKPNSVLINAARGGIVDEAALYIALKEKKIHAACFDVFSSEPPKSDEPLLDLDNFFLTAHTASRTIESDIRTCQISSRIVLEHLNLDKRRGYLNDEA